MKGKITAVLFILVFLLVVAVVFTFLTSLDRRREAAESAPVGQDVVVTDVTPAPTEAVQTVVTPVPYTAPDQSATSAPIPAATPAVTESAVIETPTPTELPESIASVSDMGAVLASGSFTSNTGKGINLRADYEARVTGANEIGVVVTVYLNSYSIHVNALPDKVNVGLNGQYVTLDSPAINYDGNTQLLTTELGSQSFTVQLPQGNSRDLDLQVEWHWGGTYGGESIPVIECGGRFTVER